MISPLALKAKKVIDAAWLHGDAYDLSSQAAFALEAACLLQSPETAAELGRLRTRVAELEARVAEYERPVDEDPIGYALAADLAEAPRGRWVVEIGRDDRDFPRFHTREHALATAHGCGLDESHVREDVTPQVRKLRDLLAGQRAQVAESADQLTRVFAPTQALREDTAAETGGA